MEIGFTDDYPNVAVAVGVAEVMNAAMALFNTPYYTTTD